MKNIFLLLVIVISCKSFPQTNCTQYTTVSLKTYNIPNKECYYFKDINNDLPAFEGTWKGIWNNKTIFIYFTKMTNKYKGSSLGYNADYLIAKFKTIGSNNNILFDNTLLLNDNAKIQGGNFIKNTDKYLMSYVDNDLCGINGFIEISFANTAKTQLNFSFQEGELFVDTDCYFYGLPHAERPEPLPSNIILTKQ